MTENGWRDYFSARADMFRPQRRCHPIRQRMV